MTKWVTSRIVESGPLNDSSMGFGAKSKALSILSDLPKSNDSEEPCPRFIKSQPSTKASFIDMYV